MVLEAGTSKTKVPADSVSGENGSLLGVSSQSILDFSSYQDTKFMQPHPHVNLIISQRPHLQILSTLGVGASTYEFWEDTIQFTTAAKHVSDRLDRRTQLLSSGS